MPVHTIRGQMLTKTTTVGGSDTLTYWPEDGGTARGITSDNYEAQLEVDGSPIVVERFATSGTIATSTELAISTGANTLSMPSTSVVILQVKSISGEITLSPGTNTVENGNTVSSGTARRFYLDGTVWIEL